MKMRITTPYPTEEQINKAFPLTRRERKILDEILAEEAAAKHGIATKKKHAHGSAKQSQAAAPGRRKRSR